VIRTFIVRKTFGCFSSGISFCKHRAFVSLLILYKIKIAKIMKMEIIIDSLLISGIYCMLFTLSNNRIKR
jgi:hypothetical protein